MIVDESIAKTSIRRLFGPRLLRRRKMRRADWTRVLLCEGVENIPSSTKRLWKPRFGIALTHCRFLQHRWVFRCMNGRATRKPRSMIGIPRCRNDRALAVICWQRIAAAAGCRSDDPRETQRNQSRTSM